MKLLDPIRAAVMGATLLAAAVAAFGEDAPAHKYIGAAKCSMCHKSEPKGNPFGVWQKSAHARAYEMLAGQAALKIAKEKGLAKPPQQSDECLKCHITGFGKPAAAFDATYKKQEGVTCEACHGPGSSYKTISIMKDQAAAVAAGLIMPDEKTCTQCHNKESPSFKSFVFKEYAAKIAHPNPQKAAAK